jgi:hypothetical protein
MYCTNVYYDENINNVPFKFHIKDAVNATDITKIKFAPTLLVLYPVSILIKI